MSIDELERCTVCGIPAAWTGVIFRKEENPSVVVCFFCVPQEVEDQARKRRAKERERLESWDSHAFSRIGR